MTITYSQYLKLDELLALQQPRSGGKEHDETLFIVIHQVYELWFKQILHELTLLRTAFETSNQPQILGTLKRVLTILKTLVSQVDILETMTPLSFSSFRQLLESSSGFQSLQFREFEMALGNRSPAKLDHLKASKDYPRLLTLLKNPSLYDSFLSYLAKLGFAIPKDALCRDLTQPITENRAVQLVLIDVYRSHPGIAQICERLVDLDEGVQEWRYRHVKMVERTIGTKIGTGGSPGVGYLATTLFKPAFPDLWAIRKDF